MSDDAADGFLSRWSRRKRAAGLVVPEVPVAEVAVPEAEAPAGAVPPAAFDLASLPAPETLTAASDITGFLRAEVPMALRRAALRRIWTLDPGIRDFIGPADYAWDYNAPDGVPGFALGLGGDVQKLLAQAMGWHADPEVEASPGPEPRVAEVEVAGVDVAALPAPRPDDLGGTVPDAGPVVGPQPATSCPEAPATEPIPARRHGGAMPS